jgi:nitroreductase
MDVEEAILSRHSVRAYLPTPVPREVVDDILRLAARAPSSTNTQPWHVYACAGAVKEALCAEVRDAWENARDEHRAERPFYPDPFPEPLRTRRRDLATSLYELAGVVMGDRAASARQFARNYDLFDAPVGLFLFAERSLETGSWLDLGMFLQTAMLAARGRGLHTCPQASWATFHVILRKHLEVPPELTFVCGMALGYEDAAAPVNRLRTDRAPVESFARFHGFA